MGHFCPPVSGSRFLIRIRIHWPDWIRIRNTDPRHPCIILCYLSWRGSVPCLSGSWCGATWLWRPVTPPWPPPRTPLYCASPSVGTLINPSSPRFTRSPSFTGGFFLLTFYIYDIIENNKERFGKDFVSFHKSNWECRLGVALVEGARSAQSVHPVSVSTCCKEDPSSNLGSAPQRRPSELSGEKRRTKADIGEGEK